MIRRLAALVLGAAALAAPSVTASGADFTAATANPGTTFATAADFNTVSVAMTDPGSPLNGSVPLAATAASERGIARVTFQIQLGGAAWTDLCTAAASPFGCTWDTTSTLNGTYPMRAVATDTAGYSRTSPAIASRVVDNLGPTVTLNDPGAYLQGTATIIATATDTGSGVVSLAISYRRAGVTAWTQLCTGATASRSCGLDTTALADGDLELQAVAVDRAGNSRSSTVLTRRVDNQAPTVTTTDPGTMRGVATVAATAGDGAGTGVASVTAQTRPAGGTTWTSICTDTTAPYSCAYDTTGSADGMYELRTTAVDATGLAGTSAILTRRIDNTAPGTSTLTDPGTMTATTALAGTAADAGSGVASWTVEYRPSGGTTWTTACADTVSPWAGCSWDTTAVADGLYDLRAVTADLAGNATTSTVITGRRVDNGGPTVTLADPGAYVRGTVALSATATDPVGVASVVFERKPAAGSTWTTICTDTTSPYSCSWNTTTLADGLYDLRAKATDTLGHVSSVTVASRQVDNTAPAPSALQAGNGGATPGRMEPGDWISFTWTEAIKPGSIVAGWTGAARTVTVQVTKGSPVDTLQLFDGTATTTALNVGGTAADISLNAKFVNVTAAWTATMVQSGATITVTLVTLRSGTVRTAAASTMTWRASTLATDLAGNACTNTLISEPGAVDVDF